MSITLSNLETMLGYWLDESGAVGGLAGGADSAEAIQFINWAYAECLRRLPNNVDIVGLKPASISWVNGTETYPLPADFRVMKRVEAGRDLAVQYHYPIMPIRFADRHYYYGQSVNADGSTTIKYYIEILDTTAVGGDTPSYTSKIGFVPVPNVTKTANIKIWYWSLSLVMDDAGDIILPLLEEYAELIAVKAARRIKAKAGLDFSVLLATEQNLEEQFIENMSRLQRQAPMQMDYVPDLWEEVGTEMEY